MIIAATGLSKAPQQTTGVWVRAHITKEVLPFMSPTAAVPHILTAIQMGQALCPLLIERFILMRAVIGFPITGNVMEKVQVRDTTICVCFWPPLPLIVPIIAVLPILIKILIQVLLQVGPQHWMETLV